MLEQWWCCMTFIQPWDLYLFLLYFMFIRISLVFDFGWAHGATHLSLLYLKLWRLLVERWLYHHILKPYTWILIRGYTLSVHQRTSIILFKVFRNSFYSQSIERAVLVEWVDVCWRLILDCSCKISHIVSIMLFGWPRLCVSCSLSLDINTLSHVLAKGNLMLL